MGAVWPATVNFHAYMYMFIGNKKYTLIYVHSRLQQEYQTLYHHSFRVSDYVPTGEGSKMKRLVEACAGLKVSPLITHFCELVYLPKEIVQEDLYECFLPAGEGCQTA